MNVVRRPVLFLPIETVARELDAKLLIAHAALRNGFDVVIGRTKYVKRAAERIGCGAYWGKSHNRKNFPFFGDGRGAERFYRIGLDEEGLVYLNDAIFLRRSKVETIDFLDTLFVWGERQYGLLATARPDRRAQIRVLGNPRFDLLRPEYGALHADRQKEIADTWGEFVLVDTNFAPGNFDARDGYGYIETLESEGRIRTDAERSFYLARMDYYARLFTDYAKMVRALSQAFPSLTIIVRPHPSEDHEHWRAELRGIANVKVVFKGNAVDWMRVSKAVIHTGCTTGIEAWALRKPVFRFNPGPVPGFESPLPNSFGMQCESIESLVDGIRDLEKSAIPFEAQVPIAKPYIESIVGESSYTKLLPFFARLRTALVAREDEGGIPPRRVRLSGRWLISLRLWISELVSSHMRWFRPFLGVRLLRAFASGEFQKFPRFSRHECVDILRAFDLAQGTDLVSQVSLRALCRDTYYLYRDEVKGEGE